MYGRRGRKGVKKGVNLKGKEIKGREKNGRCLKWRDAEGEESMESGVLGSRRGCREWTLEGQIKEKDE